MTIPDKCWLVTQGEYSDYTVLAVCATKEAAETWLEAYKARRLEERRNEWETMATRFEKAWYRTPEAWIQEMYGPWSIDEWDVTT